jgi:hypothetical protein
MVGPQGGCWFKSSFSGGTGGGCVEVRFIDAGVQVRHSRDPGGAVLKFTRGEWEAFLLGVFSGEFELP